MAVGGLVKYYHITSSRTSSASSVIYPSQNHGAYFGLFCWNCSSVSDWFDEKDRPPVPFGPLQQDKCFSDCWQPPLTPGAVPGFLQGAALWWHIVCLKEPCWHHHTWLPLCAGSSRFNSRRHERRESMGKGVVFHNSRSNALFLLQSQKQISLIPSLEIEAVSPNTAGIPDELLLLFNDNYWLQWGPPKSSMGLERKDVAAAVKYQISASLWSDCSGFWELSALCRQWSSPHG